MIRNRSKLLYGNKRRKWDRARIIEAIKNSPHKYSSWVKKNNNALWKAGVRYFGSWKDAVTAAGYDYDSIRKPGPSGEAPNRGAGGTCKSIGCSGVHHAKGYCKRCYAVYLRKLNQQKQITHSNKGPVRTPDNDLNTTLN